MLLFPLFLQTPTHLSLDFTKPGVAVSPRLYGLMTEEINYSYDGGLYAELIRNRAFLDDAKQPSHWSAVGEGASINLEQTNHTAARPMALRVTGGASNDGYWGIPVRPSTRYRLTLSAKADVPGPIDATIESPDGATVYAKTQVNGVDRDWRNLEVTLNTGSVIPTTNARFVLRTGRRTVWLEQISLFQPTYKNRKNGNRPDLMRMLVDMKPKFLRFPGGNYLEGNTLADRFPWKETLGPIETRPGHWSPWGYRSTDGMGLLEFLQWSEDVQAKPLLAVYAGYALNGSYIKPGPDLQPVVEDALDEIEYVTGGPETKWGARRAKDGHPKPFPLECVEVGNEDGFDRSGSYEARFIQIYDAIKAKYPQLKVISTTGGTDSVGVRFPIKQRKPDLWDEHYYSDAWNMMEMATKYDTYDRKGPQVFVGEWASFDRVAPWESGPKAGPTANMRCALGDAAFMTGLERNSDVVKMACYAPLLVNVNPGGRQWSLNLIGYDALSSFGSPSYYAQKLFVQNLGDRTVPLSLSGVPRQIERDRSLPALFASATTEALNGNLYIKLVNPLSTAQDVTIDLNGYSPLPDGTSTTLAGELKAINSLTDPTKVAPVTTELHHLGSSFSQNLPAYSIVVLKLRKSGS